MAMQIQKMKKKKCLPKSNLFILFAKMQKTCDFFLRLRKLTIRLFLKFLTAQAWGQSDSVHALDSVHITIEKLKNDNYIIIYNIV